MTEVLKEREAQIELRKLLEQLNREHEKELEQLNQKRLDEKDKFDEESYRKKREEVRKIYEFNKQKYVNHVAAINSSIFMFLDFLFLFYFVCSCLDLTD